MSRLVFTILIVSILAFACTNDDSKSSINARATRSPELSIQTINDECLDLESIIRQIEDPAFQFQSFTYTRNFEVLSATGELEFTRTLIARSFRAEVTSLKGFADFHELKQEGCTRVSIPDAGQISLSYRIGEFSQNHLQLELETDALKKSIVQLSDTHQEAILDFPAVTKILIRVLNPLRIQVISTFRSIEMECPKVKSQEIREDRIYTWVANEATMDRSVELDPGYTRQLLELLPGFTPMNTPAAQDRIRLQAQEVQQLLAALQARTYAPCN